MKIILSALFVLMSTLSAQAWTVEEMNKTINSVNFIVDKGCSGTYISKEHRLILTNHHCVGNAYRFRDKEFVEDGIIVKKRIEERRDLDVVQKVYDHYRLVGQASYKAELIARWKESDLALLQIRTEIPNAIEATIFSGDTVHRGETVYAIGNPLGLDATVTKGIISSTNRMFRVSWADAEVPFIQLDAGITGGNSGGSLFNEDGELIGVPAAGVPNMGHLGLAIPSHRVQKFLTDNCYGEVWNKDLSTHQECVDEKEKEKEEDK